MKGILTTPHKAYREHKYIYPLYGYANPTMEGFIVTHIKGPAGMPSGFGFNLALDGVVSDNSELGQEYGIRDSIKITRPDYFQTGKPRPENEFYIDQFAVIQKSSNRN